MPAGLTPRPRERSFDRVRTFERQPRHASTARPVTTEASLLHVQAREREVAQLRQGSAPWRAHSRQRVGTKVALS